MKGISLKIVVPLTVVLSLVPLAQSLTINYATNLEKGIIKSELSRRPHSSPSPEKKSPSLDLDLNLQDVKSSTEMSLMTDDDTDRSTAKFSGKLVERIDEKVQGRACPACLSDCDDSIPGYKVDPLFLSKLFIALFLGTVAYFCFLFGYKLWAFENVPYELSPSFVGLGSDSGSGSGYGGYSKRSGGSGSAEWNSVWLQTQSAILKAIEKLY